MVTVQATDVYVMCMTVKMYSLKKPHKNTTKTPWGARKGFLESLTVPIYRLVSTYQQMKVVVCELTTKTEFWGEFNPYPSPEGLRNLQSRGS